MQTAPVSSLMVMSKLAKPSPPSCVALPWRTQLVTDAGSGRCTRTRR
jgi:hypothetical protein